MPTAFVKMHGAGNDFAILDGRRERLLFSAVRLRALADRQTGIGWDQLIVLEAAALPADVLIRIFNPDGSTAGACGNATRCVASLLCDETGRRTVLIKTSAGLLRATRCAAGDIEVDMGPPGLAWRDIPLAMQADTLHLPLPGDPVATSMGNPHATLFLVDPCEVDPAVLGPALERHPIFPDRANIGFAVVEAPDRIRLRVWERGAGLTRACGSGACAALVGAHRRGLVERRATLVLDGGTLHIDWREADGHVLMTGPAAVAFHGSVDLATYPA